MNKAYRLIWNRAKDAWVIAAEIVKGNGGPPSVTVCAVMVAASLALAAGDAQALPTAPTVINGAVTFGASGTTLTVTNSPNSIINWQAFSIAANETVRFNQQSAFSAVLNRITGLDPSLVLGSLQSNGKVFLINPNGIIFGQGSRIDVGGLVASSLGINNRDFLAGSYRFSADSAAGAVKNQGAITTTAGGLVWLISPNVENSGVITSPGGSVMLAAGQSVHMVDPQNPEIAVVVSAPVDQAVNIGTVLTQGGSVGMFGSLVRQQGVINADSAVAGPGGRIFLKSTTASTLAANSVTSANGARGGNVTIQSTSGDTQVSGSVSATGNQDKGGNIQILGKNVSIAGTNVDASGATGGGTVLVGGDYKGSNPAAQNALTAYLSGDSIITADALFKGDGGKVIVWSQDSTRVHGTLSARGGAQGGNGGFIETSGHLLNFAGVRVNASASKGKGGLWLIDPNDLNITDATALNAALDLGTSIEVDTSGSTQFGTVDPAGNGDITVNADITKTTGGDASLTLKAERNIIVNNQITSTFGKLDVTLNAHYLNDSAPGYVSIQNNIYTNGGNLVVGGGTNPAITPAIGMYGYNAGSGVSMGFRSRINTGAGNVTINGQGAFGYYGGHGVVLDGSIYGANITLRGKGGDGYGSGYSGGRGVFVNDYVQSSGNILITGNGGKGGANGDGAVGIFLRNGPEGDTLQSEGVITLNGFGGDGGFGGKGGFGLDAGYGSIQSRLSSSAGPTVNITGHGGFADGGSGIQSLGVTNSRGSGSSMLSASSAVVTAQGGINLHGDLGSVTLNNSKSGDVVFTNGYNYTGLVVRGSNLADGGGFSVTDNSGKGLTAASITTVNGPIVLQTSGFGVTNDINISGAINAGTGGVTITAGDTLYVGSITSLPGGSITAGSATLTAENGIGSSAPLRTAVGTLSANNDGTGNVRISNIGTLTVTSLFNTGGSITLDNIGAVTLDGAGVFAGYTPSTLPLSATFPVDNLITSNCDITVTAHSPLTVNGPVAATGNISLTAGANGSPLDTLLINSSGFLSAGSNATLSAGNLVTMNAPVLVGQQVPPGILTINQSQNPPPPLITERDVAYFINDVVWTMGRESTDLSDAGEEIYKGGTHGGEVDKVSYCN